MDYSFLWSALAIWLAALWVAVWQWFLIYTAMEIIWKNPKKSNFYLTTAILWIALVESAAIYGLIIAFQILWNNFVDDLSAIWIGLSIWLTGLWVWIWEGIMISGALEAMNKDTENRNKILTFMILFLALIESAAIYGLIVSFQLISNDEVAAFQAIWAWLAIWLSGLWVWIGEWIMSKKAIKLIWDNSSLSNYFLPITILWIALVESAAIYGLIIAFNIIDATLADPMLAVWAWLAVWLAWLWVWIWEGLMVSWALESMAIWRINKWKILTYMILFIALVESAAIYGLIISFQLLNSELVWMVAIWAWLAIWLAGLWVWVWEWILTKKAITVMWRRPRLAMFFLTVSILWVALVESAAIYWLVVSLKILTWGVLAAWAIWAWVSIWLAALWAWIGEWILVWWTFDSMSRNPANKTKDLTFMILFLAMVEVLAIYGLIVAFNIIG